MTSVGSCPETGPEARHAACGAGGQAAPRRTVRPRRPVARPQRPPLPWYSPRRRGPSSAGRRGLHARRGERIAPAFLDQRTLIITVTILRRERGRRAIGDGRPRARRTLPVRVRRAGRGGRRSHISCARTEWGAQGGGRVWSLAKERTRPLPRWCGAATASGDAGSGHERRVTEDAAARPRRAFQYTVQPARPSPARVRRRGLEIAATARPVDAQAPPRARAGRARRAVRRQRRRRRGHRRRGRPSGPDSPARQARRRHRAFQPALDLTRPRAAACGDGPAAPPPALRPCDATRAEKCIAKGGAGAPPAEPAHGSPVAHTASEAGYVTPPTSAASGSAPQPRGPPLLSA